MSEAFRRTAGSFAAIAVLTLGVAWGQAGDTGTSDWSAFELPEKEKLIVESVPEPEGSLVSVDGVALIRQTQRLIDESRVVAELLDQAGVDDNFFKESWRELAAGALVDLDSARNTLNLAQPPARYAEHFELVLQAGGEFGRAVDIVRAAIEMDRPQYSEARKRLDGGEPLAVRGLEELRRARLAELAERPAPAPDPFEARQRIGSLCGTQSGQTEGFRYDRCVEAQMAAFGAITNRHSFTELLDEPTFNTIRNRCLEEWSSDFVARDRCERQGLDSARSR